MLFPHLACQQEEVSIAGEVHVEDESDQSSGHGQAQGLWKEALLLSCGISSFINCSRAAGTATSCQSCRRVASPGL